MKAIFISYNKALSEAVMTILDRQRIRGYTQWETVTGRGSVNGEPHLGNHTWPSSNSAILTIVGDDKVEPLLSSLRKLDAQTEMQGARPFVWNIEGQL